MGKRVLVIGQGAREHALVWRLSQSPQVEKIYAVPGNAGIEEIAQCFDIKATDGPGILDLVEKLGIDMTVVGPEAPLMEGIVDLLERHGRKVFGPRQNAAILEGSKVFTKDLLKKYGIPTADYGVFTDLEAARDYLKDKQAPIVVKADGLAAGKGVVVALEMDEAYEALDTIMKERAFGSAGDQVVIEEFLDGEEVSVFGLCDGKIVIPMVAAQDHKRIFDGDKGPNTGGMGAYSPPPIYTEELHARVMEEIMQPTVDAMAKEGRPYKGVLYAGLMITNQGPKVLEYNVRLGDPEAQVVLSLLDSDLYTVLEAVVDGNLDKISVEFKDQACICVVLASAGYPGSYEKGKIIKGIKEVSPGTMVFHAGTQKHGSDVATDGGRVLSVVSMGDNVAEAISNVYREIPKISFEGMQYRTDIGAKALACCPKR